MPTIELKNICKVYNDNVLAVSNFNMKIEEGEFIVFVGPSGCGKSTTLRMIAGLEKISSGELYIDDEYMNNTEPKDRDLAMVFQNYALYPFLTVSDNISFGLKLRHLPKKEISERVKNVAEMLELTDYLHRKPAALSGGQRQRVALGRAIVREANAYLLDEPLSNLDAKLRASMRVEIVNLFNKIKKTFIYVTHDQVEAMTMGTRIVVMNKGVIQQIDTPTNIYDYPKNLFVAGFIGTPQMNFIDASVQIVEGRAIATFAQGNQVELDKELYQESKLSSSPIDFTLGIRSENVKIEEKGIPATVEMIEMLGSETLIHAHFDSDSKKQLVIKTAERVSYKHGDSINVVFNKAKIHLFEKINDQSIYKE